MKNLKDKIVKVISGKKFMIVVSFLGLYLLSAGISMAVFSFLGKEPSFDVGLGDGLEGSRGKIADLPKTEECPINGGKFSKVEREIWESRRPITAMIENHADSRPASGLSRADVVYEAVAEGGITRFLAVFYCGAAASEVNIAPVRSARVYYIDWASEYADFPIFMHVGGANNYSGDGSTVKDARALELLQTLGWRVPRGNDFDTTYDSGFPVFWRNYERLGREVATEHTMMASLDEAYQQAEKRGFGAKNEDGVAWDKKYVSWKFADDAPASGASEISFDFWEGKSDYEVTWKYDGGGNRYLRVNAGKDFTDHETKEQVSAKNVVIMFVTERGPVDKNGHMLYTTTGSGEALIFQNGKAIEATWKKETRAARTKFMDSDGKEISFVRGPIWIEAVPAGNEVKY
jgi:hypothetical protein